MTKVSLPMSAAEWQTTFAKDGASIVSLLGISEGLILEVLATKKSCGLSELVTELDEPSIITIMAVGALMRQGLLKANKSNDRIMLELS